MRWSRRGCQGYGLSLQIRSEDGLRERVDPGITFASIEDWCEYADRVGFLSWYARRRRATLIRTD